MCLFFDPGVFIVHIRLVPLPEAFEPIKHPFRSYDELFIASLCLGDRSLTIHVQSVSHLPPEEIAKTPHVLDYQNGELVQIR